jgi:hypothetical protein
MMPLIERVQSYLPRVAARRPQAERLVAALAVVISASPQHDAAPIAIQEFADAAHEATTTLIHAIATDNSLSSVLGVLEEFDGRLREFSCVTTTHDSEMARFFQSHVPVNEMRAFFAIMTGTTVHIVQNRLWSSAVPRVVLDRNMITSFP